MPAKTGPASTKRIISLRLRKRIGPNRPGDCNRIG
jgi:hypothetical protein